MSSQVSFGWKIVALFVAAGVFLHYFLPWKDQRDAANLSAMQGGATFAQVNWKSFDAGNQY